MKKFITTLGVAAVFISGLFAADFGIRIMPSFNMMLDGPFSNVIEGTASLDFSPLTVRGRDRIYIGAQGSGSFLIAEGLDTLNVFDGDLALGYEFRINDRVSVSLEGFGGVWNFTGDDKHSLDSASGITYGGRLLGSYYLSPSFVANVFGGVKQYYYKPTPFMTVFEIGIGINYNFTRGLFSKTNIAVTDYNVDYLFPVFYSRYDNHSFGNVMFVNEEPNDITDVQVTVFIPQFMNNPGVVAEYPIIHRNEDFEVELKAFLNENILNSLAAKNVDAVVTVNYRSLGAKRSYSETLSLYSLMRNNMTWEDDRAASAFVSGRDASVEKTARQIASYIKSETDPNVPYNIQYAAAVFGALKDFGLNYVIDASSAFTDNFGTAALDSLNYPYMTLLYHGGDCDDLSILNCSIFEAVGIKSAFITVPGHIYMAFDSGLSVAKAKEVLVDGKYIVYDDIVWIPIEITMTQDSFYEEWAKGVQEWNKNSKDAVIIPMYEAWMEYSPVSIPESDKKIQLGSKDKIISNMRNGIRALRGKCLK